MENGERGKGMKESLLTKPKSYVFGLGMNESRRFISSLIITMTLERLELKSLEVGESVHIVAHALKCCMTRSTPEKPSAKPRVSALQRQKMPAWRMPHRPIHIRATKRSQHTRYKRITESRATLPTWELSNKLLSKNRYANGSHCRLSDQR